MPFSVQHTGYQRIHNHIKYNLSSRNCPHKFWDFIGSVREVLQPSDRGLENALSVITRPKLHNKDCFLNCRVGLGRSASPTTRKGGRRPFAMCYAFPKTPYSFEVFLRLMEELCYVVKQGHGSVISSLMPRQ